MTVTRLAVLALILLALLSAASVISMAQMQACATAQTQTDMNVCAAGEYKKHDAAMNQIYQQLLAKLTDPQQKSLLVDAERAWIAYRDKQCAFQTSGSVGGSIHPMIESDCLDEKTNVHTAELSRQLNCKEGDPSCVQ
jgi:uncharacterized protein YecT (DUF1311 family)